MNALRIVLACAAAALVASGGHAASIFGFVEPDGTLRLTDIPDDPRYQLLLAEHDGSARRVGAKLLPMNARPFHAEITAAARRHGLEPALLHAVISAESAYRAQAVSHKGARGLMQVMPATAARYGFDAQALAEPAANIAAGSRYLADLLRMFSGDLRLALAAYNAGEHAVLRYGWRVPPFPETEAYVPRVLKVYDALRVR
jgi:soluble lytic murein transglycosylase-like protein